MDDLKGEVADWLVARGLAETHPCNGESTAYEIASALVEEWDIRRTMYFEETP